MAELRIEALRRLRSFSPSGSAFLVDELGEAERQLRYRQLCLASCRGDTCSHRCKLFDPVPQALSAAPLRPAI
jgi:hypothetical protein